MSKNKKKKNKNNKHSNNLISSVLDVFRAEPNKILNYKQIAKKLNISGAEDRKWIIKSLGKLKQDGILSETERGKYRLKAKTSYFIGTVDMTALGAAYVICPELEEDIYIAPRYVRQALNGDKVKVHLHVNKKSRRLQGEIVEVVQRARKQFIGIVKVHHKFGFLIPDDPKMPVDLYIPMEALKGVQDGEKAIGKITDWPSGATNPFGEIIEVLGMPGDNEVEMQAILAGFDFPLSFPDEVLREAEEISTEISKDEIKKRKDFRQITTFTIDPVDAKDFDDALSLRKLENGNWEVGVHIADVTHYVQPGTALDDEAIDRATSIYLVDRVIPMLPEKLSNQVCSLRPNEEKLTFSAIFEMDDNAQVLGQWFGRTIINSDRRFTYEEAQMVIETGEGDFKDEISVLDGLAKKLREARFRDGAIGFEKGEVKFHLDEKGNPIGVYFKEMKDSNYLIEDFMLLANRKVAEFIGKPKPNEKRKTFVYRIHDNPSTEKLQDFNNFISKFGYQLKATKGTELAHSMNKLLKEVKGKGEQNVIEQLAIRSMAKAIYSTENIGHYGLAFDYYTHFTSPIRRYPDVMVHRLLEHYLSGGASANEEEYEKLCEHSSAMEKKATDAERASVKFKQAQFLQDKVGEVFKGMISGVTEWGIYIELLENHCEGMVRLKDIDDDFYVFDEDQYCITGQISGARYQLGDEVTVSVKGVNLDKKQIDFLMEFDED